MNSLNLLSSRVIGQATTPSRARSRSQGESLRSKLTEELLRGRSYSEERVSRGESEDASGTVTEHESAQEEMPATINDVEDEKQPLLDEHTKSQSTNTGLRYLIKRITDALTAFLATIGMPAVYVVSCFQDDDGHYSLMAPLRRKRRRKDLKTPLPASSSSVSNNEKWSDKPVNRSLRNTKIRHKYSDDSLNLTTSESENDQKKSRQQLHSSDSEKEEVRPRRQSARIKLLHNDEAIEKRRRKSALAEDASFSDTNTLTVESIKSPTSSSLRVHRYPHSPQPPRPLVPRRQPSYSNLIPRSPSRFGSFLQQKTLVIDLDETLIHSMAKGGRMSTGHMVEVKLNVPVAVSPPQTGQQPPAVIGPQHPILYYVHKRPHCDEFLRKIVKWYKLVIFTASVQEYADPVIDWLEQERKYFHGRYYRQHCTFRNGSYIKDLSSIEPDLSKVMILDNSPMSYIFHEDNAIPIEGWINDPTDNDLLHLVPLLEALQYANDVRALLALRRGEVGAS